MNAFKKIELNDELPEHVKKEMLSSLDTLKLFADFVELFFVKGGSVVSRSLTPGSEKDADGRRKTD